MALDHCDDRLDTDTEPTRISRRAILRRSVVGIIGAGAMVLLAACGDDEEGDPADVMDSEPLEPDSTPVDDDIDVAPETVEDEAGG